jgi:hypothetical protein
MCAGKVIWQELKNGIYYNVTVGFLLTSEAIWPVSAERKEFKIVCDLIDGVCQSVVHYI